MTKDRQGESRWRAALLLCTTTPSAPAQPCVISPSVKPLKTERLDSSLLRGSRGRSRAVHRFASVAIPLQNVPRPAAHLNNTPKGEIFHTRKARISPRRRRDFTRQRSCRISLRLAREQGAEGAPAPCTDLPRWHYPFKMCRDPRHTSVFHAPEARFIPPKGCFIPPKGCFMCRRHA